MEGLVKDRLAYCDNCQTMRVFFASNIPPVDGATEERPGTDYICATCYNIIATFETITPKEFTIAAQDIDDPELQRICNM